MMIEETYEVVANIVQAAYNQVVAAYPPNNRPSKFKFTLEPGDKQIYVDIEFNCGDVQDLIAYRLAVWVTTDDQYVVTDVYVKFKNDIYRGTGAGGGEFTIPIAASRRIISDTKKATVTWEKIIHHESLVTISSTDLAIEIMDYWADSLQEAFNLYIKSHTATMSDEDIPSKFFDIL